MDIFKDQDFIPLRTFINTSLDLFGKEISCEELAYLIFFKKIKLYIHISGNQEMFFIGKEIIEKEPILSVCGEIDEYYLIKYDDKEEIIDREIIEDSKKVLKNEFSSITLELIEKGRINLNKGRTPVLQIMDTRKQKPIYFREKAIRISNSFKFNGYFPFIVEFEEIVKLYKGILENKEALTSARNLTYGFFIDLLKGENNKEIIENIDIIEHFICLYLTVDIATIFIDIKEFLKGNFNFIDNLYIHKKDIEEIIKNGEITSPILKEYNKNKQLKTQIIQLKNKLAYDGNPTEINTLKSIIAGLLCIIDPSRPIDRRYLTKSGKLSKNKLANDVEKCLKTLSPEEIKKVSNRTIRNHFSKITKSKAN
ncbi:hypothetical protein ACLSZ7_07545 [Avibacterium gallinarum]|uniref:Uncharacterized protein n=1 Tax=uncultured Avibacterium sp. TaxID=1936169 RepID=A0A486XEY6_9PAST|nr:Uncharacterised protein [uncultured Avibacterium sp.]